MWATLKNFTHALSGSSIMQLATLACALIVSNMFGPLGLSKFSIVQTTIVTAASVLPFGLSYTAITFIGKHRDNKFSLQVANFAFQICFFLSLIAAVAVFILAVPIAEKFFSDSDLFIYLIFAAIGIPFATLAVIQYALLNGYEAYAEMARSAFLSALATVGIVSLAAYFGGLTGAIIGFLTALIVRTCLLHWSLTKICQIKIDFPSLEVWRKIRHFAIPTGMAGLIFMPSSWYANTLLIKHEGLPEQGVMMAALTIRTAISFVPQQLSTVLLPQYMSAQLSSRAAHLWKIASYVTLMAGSTLVLCAIAYGLKSPLVSAFGEGFHANPTVFALLLASVVFEAGATPFSHVHAKYEKMVRFVSLYSYPKDILFLLLCIFLIPTSGATGLAIAFLVSSIYGFVSVGASALILIGRD